VNRQPFLISQRAAVNGGHLLELFTRDTLAACIERMRLSRQATLAQPTAQGLGINPKQATPVHERNQGQDRRSFRVK
jgi:hypothetical protein